MGRSRAAAHAAAPFEDVGGLRLRRGSGSSYQGVRGGRGGAGACIGGSPRGWARRAALLGSPRPAAIALARVRQRVAVRRRWQNHDAVSSSTTVSLPYFGAVTAGLCGCPLALSGLYACALLRPEQAAAAVARGVVVAMAEKLGVCVRAMRGLCEVTRGAARGVRRARCLQV